MRALIPSTTPNGVDDRTPPRTSVRRASADRLCRTQRETAREDREAAKQSLLAVDEQVVAPPNRVTHGLLPQGLIARRR